MSSLNFTADNLDDTDRLANAIAASLKPPLVIGLNGPLGAGKTQFVRCLAASLGVDPHVVVSPTFSLCQTYEGRVRIHHLDVYRIKSDDEFLDLGPDEFFDDDAITLIEWSERVAEVLPDDRLDIRIDALDIDRRRFTFAVTDQRSSELLAELKIAISRIS